MSILLDLLLIAIILFCGWRGFQTGIINGICGILAVIIALYGANLVSSVYSGEFSGMVDVFVGGMVDSSMSDILIWDEDEDTEDKPVVALDDNQKSDVYSLSYAIYRQLGLFEGTASDLAREVEGKVDEVGREMAAEAALLLCIRITYVALSTIVFLLILIIFSAIGNIFDLSFGIPGHENINHIGGAAAGVVKGIMLVLVLCSVGRYFGIFMSQDTITETWLFEKLLVSNKIASILGI